MHSGATILNWGDRPARCSTHCVNRVTNVRILDMNISGLTQENIEKAQKCVIHMYASL